MHLCERNEQTIYYRNFKEMAAITKDGYETGEYEKTYYEVKSVRAYVKSALGTNAAEPFGDFTSKQRTIFYRNGKADMNEFSQVWVGIDPTLDLNGKPTVPNNFTVDGVAVGLNHTRVLIRAVEVKLNG